MFRKVSRKTVLVFTLFCLLSLGMGTILGYGIGTQGLLGAAVTANPGTGSSDALINTPDTPDNLGGAQYNFGTEIFAYCRNCSQGSMFPRPLPAGGPICPLCGEVIPT